MVCHASELQGQSSVCILYVGRSVYISYNDNGVRGFVVFAVCIIFSYDSLSICTKKHRIHRKIISDHTGNQHDLFNGYHSVPTDKYMGGIEDSRECWSSSAWRRDDGRACWDAGSRSRCDFPSRKSWWNDFFYKWRGRGDDLYNRVSIFTCDWDIKRG